jgi:hypothetical protein
MKTHVLRCAWVTLSLLPVTAIAQEAGPDRSLLTPAEEANYLAFTAVEDVVSSIRSQSSMAGLAELSPFRSHACR